MTENVEEIVGMAVPADAALAPDARVSPTGQSGSLEPARVGESLVYFIQSVHGGAIKIGHSADVYSRLRTLQHAFPYKLEIIAYMPGGEAEEFALHARLAPFRLRGEWFEAVPAVLAAAAELTAQYALPAPRWPAMPRNAKRPVGDFEAFVRVSFLQALIKAYPTRIGQAKAIARDAETVPRTASGWLTGESIPQVPQAMKLAVRNPIMKAWTQLVAVVGEVRMKNSISVALAMATVLAQPSLLRSHGLYSEHVSEGLASGSRGDLAKTGAAMMPRRPAST